MKPRMRGQLKLETVLIVLTLLVAFSTGITLVFADFADFRFLDMIAGD